MPGLPRRPAQRRGHNARLTDEQVVEIASRTNLTQVELAKMYGVTQCQISRIRAGQSWGLLTGSVKRVGRVPLLGVFISLIGVVLWSDPSESQPRTGVWFSYCPPRAARSE